MRAFTLAVSISILAGAALAQTAQPQAPANTDRPLTRDGSATVPLAPVGHRQPTERGLPPSVRQEENAATPGRLEPPGVPKVYQGCSEPALHCLGYSAADTFNISISLRSRHFCKSAMVRPLASAATPSIIVF
jgi:hypothetical protein